MPGLQTQAVEARENPKDEYEGSRLSIVPATVATQAGNEHYSRTDTIILSLGYAPRLAGIVDPNLKLLACWQIQSDRM